MPNSNSTMIKKLQTAINGKGEKLLYNTSQFYSEDQKRPVTMYHIKKAVWDEQKQRNQNTELFKSTSQIQIVLFLRDYWYKLNNIPLPTDNPEWEKIKEKFKNDKTETWGRK
jgi:hypothetical protein